MKNEAIYIEGPEPMFGKKMPLSGCLNVAPYAELLAGSNEFLRMWARPDGEATCFVLPAAISPDPFAFGMALVDCVRHGAKAYAEAVGISEQAALVRIWDGFDAERSHPTDNPTSLTDKGSLN